MAEYIEREAALKKLLQCADVYNPECSDITVAHAMRKIRAIPAADVVPVVRCRECVHSALDYIEERYCKGVAHTSCCHVPDDWFCADGKRKDGDKE